MAVSGMLTKIFGLVLILVITSGFSYSRARGNCGYIFSMMTIS